MGAPLAQEKLSQRMLALELRYAIDVAILVEKEPAVGRVASKPAQGRAKELVDQHPLGMKSQHVRHNLGKARLAWLREKGMIE